MPEYITFFVHGINFALMMVDLFISRNVFYLKHVLFFFAYAIIYCIWSIVHFMAKVGTSSKCDDYPTDECPIYNVLDWHKPSAALIMSTVIVFCVVPLFQYPLWWCVYKRRDVDDYRQSRLAMDAAASSEIQGVELGEGLKSLAG